MPDHTAQLFRPDEFAEVVATCASTHSHEFRDRLAATLESLAADQQRIRELETRRAALSGTGQGIS